MCVCHIVNFVPIRHRACSSFIYQCQQFDSFDPLILSLPTSTAYRFKYLLIPFTSASSQPKPKPKHENKHEHEHHFKVRGLLVDVEILDALAVVFVRCSSAHCFNEQMTKKKIIKKERKKANKVHESIHVIYVCTVYAVWFSWVHMRRVASVLICECSLIWALFFFSLSLCVFLSVFVH